MAEGIEKTMSSLLKVDSSQRNRHTDEIISITVDALKKGALIIYPTETVYGLGVDCFNEEALGKLYKVKKRDKSKPVSLIAADIPMVMEYIDRVPDSGKKMMNRFWPGPLTLIFKAAAHVNSMLTGGIGIGFRVPDNVLCRMLSKKLGRPITSTSANLSGGKECRTIAEIPQEIKAAADVILDEGTTRRDVPSTVISVAAEPPELLRDGAISKTVIESYLGVCLK